MFVGTITISPDELSLDHTLTPGQSFRWRKDAQGRWIGALGRRVIRVWREGQSIRYEMYPGPPDDALIRDYFGLDVRLADLYEAFIRADRRIARAIERFKGLRVLRQDPEETLLSYVCTAANSIVRIITAIEGLSARYGEKIAELDGCEHHAFPTAQALARTEVGELASIPGLGFRGTNLVSVARQLLERPPGWLESLRQVGYEEARAELLKLRCIGLKIADCVLLFSLDKDQAFPVDTHIRRMAVSHYLPEFEEKTLTPAVYGRIVDYFQQRFGPYAGWAQEYLYYDDLFPDRSSQ